MNFFQKSNNILRINSLYHQFGKLPVLNNISLTIKSNELISLIGPSGCGKSTLFNIISGLIIPDKGSIIFNHKEITGKTGMVSYMHQNDLLLPWKKIIDNCRIPLILQGIKRNESRKIVKEHLKRFELEKFTNLYPHQLSGGMRQRAAMLRTYLFSNKIMLLDEPFSSLDAMTRSKMHHWLLKIFNEINGSILFITHDIDEAIILSNKIYVLSERPAKIKEEIIVDIKKPEYNQLIASKKFYSLKKRILDLL